MTSDPGLTNAVLYNPRQLSRETLKAIFTARRGLLDRLVEDLHAKRPTHQLIVGPRGMGKTTLLRRVGIAIEDDPKLAKRLLPLTFPEEQYNVGSLGEFYLNCLDALADYFDKHNDPVSAQKLDTLVQELRRRPEAELVEDTEAALVRQAKTLKRQFVLLVDNLSIILDRLSDKEKWRLREWLSRSEQRPVLVAATVKFISDTADYGQALYEFLHVQELAGCSTEEAAAVLRQLAEVFQAPQVKRWLETDPARLAVLNRLAGGAPRTLVMLFQLLVQGMDGPVFQELESLLDLATPLYKARFEELPDQAQRVVDALALHWDPATRQVLEQDSRIEGNAISSQLSRLAKMGLVEEVSIPGQAKVAYQIAERFFNIWYLMRASRRSRHQLRWLVEFLKAFYSADERGKLANKMLRSEACEPLSHGKRLLALSQAVDDGHLQRELRNTAFYEFAKAGRQHRADMDLSDIDRDWVKRLDELETVAEKEKFILKGIEAEPDSATLYFELGQLYEDVTKQYMKAEKAFRTAAKLNPEDAWPRIYLANLLAFKLEMYHEAEHLLQEAVGIEPNAPGPNRLLALFWYMWNVNKTNAESYARQACVLEPIPERCHTLACILASQGKIDESLVWIEPFLAALQPEPSQLELTGLLYYFRELLRQDHVDLAVQLLKGTDRSEAWRPLTEALVAAGKRDRGSLKRINPEQREAAEKIYDFLMEPLPETKEET